jgi:hypothetical protein
MAHVDVVENTELQQITVAAIARAAGRGLFTAAEAELLIDRIHAHATTPASSIKDSQRSGVGEHPHGHAPVDPDRTVR